MTTARLRGVLFDLDDTLFDHNHATKQATAAIHDTVPAFSVWSPDELRRRHSEMLELIHQEVVAGRMPIDEARRQRFRRLLADAGADAAALEGAMDVALCYRREYERHWRAVEGAIDLLNALKARGLRIAIVTNNLTAEQEMKLRSCALDGLIDALITSEAVGVAKPHVGIYTKALTALAIGEQEAVMVGDAWDTDIVGAIAAGVRPLWFNWRGLPARDERVCQIAALTPLEEVLAAVAGISDPQAVDPAAPARRP